MLQKESPRKIQGLEDIINGISGIIGQCDGSTSDDIISTYNIYNSPEVISSPIIYQENISDISGIIDQSNDSASDDIKSTYNLCNSPEAISPPINYQEDISDISGIIDQSDDSASDNKMSTYSPCNPPEVISSPIKSYITDASHSVVKRTLDRAAVQTSTVNQTQLNVEKIDYKNVIMVTRMDFGFNVSRYFSIFW